MAKSLEDQEIGTSSDAFPPAHYAVYSNPLDGREDALERWYEDVHIPDSLDAGLFDSVRRYRAKSPGKARFLTLWGCRYRDTEDALAHVRPVAESLRARNRIEVVQEVVFQEFVFLQRVFAERGPEAERSEFLTTIHSRWADAAKLAPFEAWVERWLASRIDEAALTEASASGPRTIAAARYGVGGDRARGVVLLESLDRRVLSQLSDTRLEADPAVAGDLPPFGDAVPIFPSGSPAPSPVEVSDPKRDDDAVVAWFADWKLVSVR